MEEAGEEFFNHLWTLIGIGQSAYAPWALAGQVGRSSGMSEESKGIRGRAVRCTVRSVGRKGSCKRACRDPFVRRTSTCRRQARALRFPSYRTPARSASAGAISVDSRRPRRLALRVPHARDLPSSYPRRLVAPAPISGRRRRHEWCQKCPSAPAKGGISGAPKHSETISCVGG
jgi:hypothetical protein